MASLGAFGRPLPPTMDDTHEAMSSTESEDSCGPPRRPLRDARQQEALQIAEDDSLTEAQKIDRMAEVRGWFSGDTARIDAYLADEISATALAAEIAAPVDKAYSTANYGRKFWETEQTARSQRHYYSPEKALELWGPEEDFEEPGAEVTDDSSTEMLLWNLYYAILHAAKRIPWHDVEHQEKLVDLVRALKARPDPPAPERMTVALKRDWIWQPGAVWSVLLMLGPSACESWNDCCGCGAGWTAPETAAWTNVNAFVARIVAGGVATMFHTYGLGALSDLERKWSAMNGHEHGEEPVIRETVVAIAALWALIAGREIYEHREGDSRSEDGEAIDIERRGEDFPWVKANEGTTAARWAFWKRRLRQEAELKGLSEQVTDLALKAVDRMQEIQDEASKG